MGFIGHSWELIIIFVIALLIFGPKKLPEMGSAIGKTVKEFRKGMDSISNPKEEPVTSYQAIEPETSRPTTVNETSRTTVDEPKGNVD